MAVVFKDKKLQEQVNSLDLGFLVLKSLLEKKEIFTPEELEQEIKDIVEVEEWKSLEN